MISFITHHGLGIQLFTYAFARSMAEDFNMKLQHIGHEACGKISSGHAFLIPQLFEVDFNEKGDSLCGVAKTYYQRHILPHSEVDITAPIVLKGWYERCDQFKKHSSKLREEWLKPISPKKVSDGIAVHVRLGDKKEKRTKPEYYLDGVSQLGEDEVTWFSDSPESPFIKNLQNKRGGAIRNEGFLIDFQSMMSFKKIVISDSTFSWWAAWLGNATQIMALKKGPNSYGGFWNSYPGVDYWPDEDRYIYI